MTKLEYDSKIYNSTAPFHISFGKYSKHMVRFSDQKISISTQNFISTHVWKPTNSWTMCSFYLCAPDATTVAYKQKYRNSWAIFSWTSLINLFFF